MFGRKEIVEMIGGVQSDMVVMRSEVTAMVGTMKAYYEKEREEESLANSRRFKVLEQRLSRAIQKATENNADDTIRAMDIREESKEREGQKNSIISKLSIIYALEKEIEVFKTENGRVGELTKEGEDFYNLLYEVVMMISKYLGSKSHMKVANRAVYNKFGRQIGLTGELVKKSITFDNGSNRESVFADILCRGIVGKFTKFLENEFLDEKEATS